MRRSKSSPTPVHTLMAEIVRKKKWQSRFELHQVFERWQALVGKEISRHAQPNRYRGKVLWLDVSDSVWLQQLQFLKNDLLVKLNRSLPQEQVEDIRFQLKNGWQDPDGHDHDALPTPSPIPSAGEVADIDGHLKDVEDEELRAAMKRCWQDFYGLPEK